MSKERPMDDNNDAAVPAHQDDGNILVAIPLFEQRFPLLLPCRLTPERQQRTDAGAATVAAADSQPPPPFHAFRRKVLQGGGGDDGKHDPAHCAILLALELCRKGMYKQDLHQKMDYMDGTDPLGYCDEDLLHEAFDLLQQQAAAAAAAKQDEVELARCPFIMTMPATRQKWNDLIRRLSRHVMYLSCEHPYVDYAKHMVPQLTNDELQLWSDALLPSEPAKPTSTTRRMPAVTASRVVVLDVQKALLDLAARETCYYAAILRDETFLPDRFSCFPSAQLEWPRGNILVPLYATTIGNDSDQEDHTPSYTFMPVLDSEDRDDAYQQRTGASCRCDRCRFELLSDGDYGDDDGAKAMGSSSLPLARHFMARGNLKDSKRLYRASLLHATASATTKLDIVHALGAIELGLGHFMTAQRLWHEAWCDDNNNNDDSVAQHAGLCLQREKMAAYRYFEPEEHDNSVVAVNCPIVHPMPGAFVARVMELKQCKQVIEWAEASGSWTTARHHAVPTHDQAVHTIPSLLDWFRQDLLRNVLQPLLVQHFGAGAFHVHDAFIVKYEATAVSNYLSIRKSTCVCNRCKHSVVADKVFQTLMSRPIRLCWP
jgi:hypothetical protein